MATKTFYVTRDMKHPLYRGRMLRHGEPLELSGPDARLYQRLGAVTAEKPKTNKVVGGGDVFVSPTVTKVIKPKAPAKKRTARKAKA